MVCVVYRVEDVVDGGAVEDAGTTRGSGILALAGDNLYTGITTVGAGTLSIGNGGTTGSVVNDIVNNGTLVLNRSNDFTFTRPWALDIKPR